MTQYPTSQGELFETFRAEFAACLDIHPDSVVPSLRLEELGLDSIGYLAILFLLEDVAETEVPEEILESLLTVDDVVDCYVKYAERAAQASA